MAYVYGLSGGLPFNDKDLTNAFNQAKQLAQQVAQQVSPAQSQQQQQQQIPPGAVNALPNLPGLPQGDSDDKTPLLLLGGLAAAAFLLTRKK